MGNQIDEKHIICAPLPSMRYVRTHRGEGCTLSAKGRLTLAGHTVRAIGLYRTDAPTTLHLAVLMPAVTAVSMDWSGYIFDVVTAFLTGEQLQRELYTRAPKDGATGCGTLFLGETFRILQDS